MRRDVAGRLSVAEEISTVDELLGNSMGEKNMTETLQRSDDTKQLAFEAIVKITVELAPHLLSMLQEVIKSNHQIETQLATLDKKLDLLLIREIQSALKLIEGVASVSSERMKAKHLDEAESNLLKNITLDPSLTMAGHMNSYWSAQAYYGLACVALLRNEQKDAGRFLLQIFMVCPKEARESLAGALYQRAFEHRCQDIVKKYEIEFAKLPHYDEAARQLKWEIRKKQLKLAGVVGLGLAAAFMAKDNLNRTMMGRTTSQATQDIDREIDRLKAQLNAIPTKDHLTAAFESEMDARCREMATAFLEDKNFNAFE